MPGVGGEECNFNYLLYFTNTQAVTTEAGVLTPLSIYLTANDTNEHKLILYSENSRSFPYLGNNKWSHLRPEWVFLNTDLEIITSITTTDSAITNGVEGYANFYYVDDMPTSAISVKLYATLDTLNYKNTSDYSCCTNPSAIIPSYMNTNISTNIDVVVVQSKPTHLLITKNGLDALDDMYWAGNSLYNVITINTTSVNTNFYQNTGIVFDYPQNDEEILNYAETHKIERGIRYIPEKIVENNKDVWIQRWQLIDLSDSDKILQDNAIQEWKTANEDESITTVPWNPLSAYFERFSEDSFYTGGYKRNRVIITDNDNAETSMATITASVSGKWNNGSTIETFSISGESSPFIIKRFKNYDIRKFNESWDSVDALTKYNPSFHITNNSVLFNQVFKSAYGGMTNESEENPSFGRQLYEKISNYVANNKDIDVCNIDQLYSMAQELDVPIDDYKLNYPYELNRLMDLISINQQVLWGANCGCNQNINTEYKFYIDENGNTVALSGYCNRCGHVHVGNRGDLFSPLTYECTAFSPFVLHDKIENKFILATPIIVYEEDGITTLTKYKLSDYWEDVMPALYNSDDFMESITPYCFYEFVDVKCGDQIAGVINWSDEYTTLDKTLSTVDDWYGDGGVIDQYLNYIIRTNVLSKDY